MRLFLTPEELCELTGRKRPSTQIKWLRERGYPVEETAAGRPIVLRAEVERRLSAGVEPERRRTPRWDKVT